MGIGQWYEDPGGEKRKKRRGRFKGGTLKEKKKNIKPALILGGSGRDSRAERV